MLFSSATHLRCFQKKNFDPQYCTPNLTVWQYLFKATLLILELPCYHMHSSLSSANKKTYKTHVPTRRGCSLRLFIYFIVLKISFNWTKSAQTGSAVFRNIGLFRALFTEHEIQFSKKNKNKDFG